MRKNQKTYLEYNAVDFPVLQTPPMVAELALRSRLCHTCGHQIDHGDECYGVYFQSNQFYPVRKNVCCVCAPQLLEDQLDKASKYAEYYQRCIKKTHKYIKIKRLADRRQLESKL